MRLIDADEVLARIENPYQWAEIASWLRDAPTIEERKTGKWIENSPVTMRCDQCGYVIRDWFWHQFRYCPNCGCSMMEGE